MSSSSFDAYNTSFDAYILDTGDYNILAFENGNNIIETAISLYSKIDVSINIIKLDISVNKEVKDFIKSICGRLIPYNSSSIVIGPSGPVAGAVGNIAAGAVGNIAAGVVGNIADKLKFDIEQIIKFHKLKLFWASYGKEFSDNVPPLKVDPISPINDINGNDTYEENYGLINQNQVYYELIETFQKKVLKSDWSSGYNVKSNDTVVPNLECNSYIIFNNVYNISLFITGVHDIKSFCEEFPEFEIIETFNDLAEDILNNCFTLFNKKTFMTKQNLVDKVESFKKLYDFPSKLGNIVENEKNKVFRFMKNMYIIDNDPVNKIGASELYNAVMNNLCIQYTDKTAFRKRLAGYFLELGLIRKRYTDGYYYYGISLRYDDKKKSCQISIEEIMNKRSDEIKAAKAEIKAVTAATKL
jgi:hypothetical protein